MSFGVLTVDLAVLRVDLAVLRVDVQLDEIGRSPLGAASARFALENAGGCVRARCVSQRFADLAALECSKKLGKLRA
jgi:hypothetical protein